MANKRDITIFRREHLDLSKIVALHAEAQLVRSDLESAMRHYHKIAVGLQNFDFKHKDIIATQKKIIENHLFFAGAIHISFAIDEMQTVLEQLYSAENAYKQVVITMKEQSHD